MTPPHNLQLTREILYNRHRLSHQQIDEWLGEKESKNYLPEKLEQMAQVHEFLMVTDAFRIVGIEFISVKGPLLSFRLYQDATYRSCRDLDFLMEISAIEKALPILYELGYEHEFFKWPRDERRKKLIIRHNKHVHLHHPEKNISIELHWKLFDNAIAPEKTIVQIVADNQIRIQFSGRDFKVFTTEFEILFLIIHGGLHCWANLKWLIDIDQYLKTQAIDQQKMNKLVDNLNAGRMVALCKAILKEFFPAARQINSGQKVNSFLRNFALESIRNPSDLGLPGNLNMLKSIRFGLIAFPDLRYKSDLLKLQIFYGQALDNERIPPYSFIYYFLGITRRVSKRLKFISNVNA